MLASMIHWSLLLIGFKNLLGACDMDLIGWQCIFGFISQVYRYMIIICGVGRNTINEGVHICSLKVCVYFLTNLMRNWKNTYVLWSRACMFLEGVHVCSEESDEKPQTYMFCAHMFLEDVHMFIKNDTFVYELYFIWYQNVFIILYFWFIINLMLWI